MEQHEHFTQIFLIWLQAGEHSQEDYSKLPNNETCNVYLKEVFRFYTFMEQENKQSESLKVLSDTRDGCKKFDRSQKGAGPKELSRVSKEKEDIKEKTIEQDKIVGLLQ
ncbi:MAG: hypothetical protein ACLT1J_13600 [Mediterraneibacter gnavus]